MHMNFAFKTALFGKNPFMAAVAYLILVVMPALGGNATSHAQTRTSVDGAVIPVPTKRPQTKTPEVEQPVPMAPKMPPIDEKAQADCENRIAGLGVSFRKIPPIDDGNGCLVPAPLEVSSLASDIALKPAAILNCQTILSAAKWTQNALKPFAAQAFPDRHLTAVRQASAYVCRSRNNRPGARLSEHATANAIDIAGFVFDDGSFHEIMIRQRTGKIEEAFQKAVRFSACLEFTTVLGPLSDPNHTDHLHFDMAERRGGYRLCRFPEIRVEKTPPPAKDTRGWTQ